MDDYQRRMTHIELLQTIVQNYHRFDSTFWSKIVRWQLEEYHRESKRILKDFNKALADHGHLEPGHRAYQRAIATATQAALAEPGPSPGDVTWADVFTVRHLFQDPALKAVIDSGWTSSDQRLELLAFIDQVLLEEPQFPPDCHAFLFT
ncbi:hypothetical protein FRC01_009639 [Tulasnella sp. 417]|nr:hypothetical protein FRC01_009639 [Tulasnella sp. 417]